MIKNLYFGGSGFNTIIFEKYFISYSCILFIKYYALRSFCIKLLYFWKTLIFPDFRSIELLLDWSKLRLKNWFESARFDHCWINWRHFRSIESNFRSIENHIESFLKLSFHVFYHLQTISKTLFSLPSIKASNQFFVVFP